MDLILRTLGRKMSVKVLPRRSGTSVAVHLALASTLGYASEDMFVLLLAITLDMVRLHLETVRLVCDVRLSKNYRNVTLVFPREKRKSIFHMIAWKSDVRI